jgi:hypothetical protein
MRSSARLLASIIVCGLGAARADEPLLRYTEGTVTLELAAPATVVAVRHLRRGVRTCTTELSDHGERLRAALDRPEVHDALRTGMSYSTIGERPPIDPGEGTLVVGRHRLVWGPFYELMGGQPQDIHDLRLELHRLHEERTALCRLLAQLPWRELLGVVSNEPAF